MCLVNPEKDLYVSIFATDRTKNYFVKMRFVKASLSILRIWFVITWTGNNCHPTWLQSTLHQLWGAAVLVHGLWRRRISTDLACFGKDVKRWFVSRRWPQRALSTPGRARRRFDANDPERFVARLESKERLAVLRRKWQTSC